MLEPGEHENYVVGRSLAPLAGRLEVEVRGGEESVGPVAIGPDKGGGCPLRVVRLARFARSANRR